MENDNNNQLVKSCSMRDILSDSNKLEVGVCLTEGENKRIKLSDEETQSEKVKELQHQNRDLMKERDDMKAERDAIQQQHTINIENTGSLNELKEIADAYYGLTSKLREQLECPVCMEVPTSGPVHVCTNGHFVCATCKRAECPTCRIKMYRANSLLAVTVIENIKHKCKYGDCEILLYLADYKIHLEACPFNPRNRLAFCPATRELCGKEMELSKIFEHISSDCKGSYNSGILMNIDTPRKMTVTAPITLAFKGIAVNCDDNIFYIGIEKLPFCSVFSIQLLGNLRECDKYVFNMSVAGEEKDGVVQKITCKPLSIDQDQDVKKMKGLMIGSMQLEEMAGDEQGVLRIRIEFEVKKI